MNRRPAWDEWYNRTMAGEFSTEEFLERQRSMRSGRRERDYQQPSIRDDAEMEAVFEYLDNPDILVRVGNLLTGHREDGETLSVNYGQGGVKWDR